MKLSEEMKELTEDRIRFDDYMSNEQYFDDLNRSIYYSELLPKIEKLEQDKKELLEALIEQVKEGMLCEDCKKCTPLCSDMHSKKLIEKHTDKTWEEIIKE